jgi:circadian clock protein KaiC
MSERLSSGHSRLDEVLGGGLPANAINVVIGLPGTGKTILAQQYTFANATPDRPALYLSTVSEPLEKIIRYGQTLDFFDTQAVGSAVFYEDLGSILNDGGLDAVSVRIGELIRERRPGIIVIDSFKALSAYADGSVFRGFLHELAGRLSAFPADSFWIGEYGGDAIAEAPEFAVADAVIALSTTRIGDRESRTLRVLKLRGSSAASGAHSYRITPSGINVFPRLADPVEAKDYVLSDVRISSGIAALDDLLADGYWPGASTLCAGPSGSGKTLMGLHFIFNGARAGDAGVIATLQENPVQLERIVSGFGWGLEEPAIELMYRSPVDVYIDEWVYDLLDTVERVGARRVLIDSLSDLQFAAPDPIRFREYIYSLSQRLSRRGISLFMTSELPDLFRTTRLSEFGVSHLSDNVVLLQYVRDNTIVRRALTVLKTRASHHQPEIREFTITPEGIVLGQAISPAPSSEPLA